LALLVHGIAVAVLATIVPPRPRASLHTPAEIDISAIPELPATAALPTPQPNAAPAGTPQAMLAGHKVPGPATMAGHGAGTNANQDVRGPQLAAPDGTEAANRATVDADAGGAPLSLEAMGLAGPNRHLLGPTNDAPPPSARETAQARVTQAMLQPLVERDGALGLGPEGPFLAAMSRSVYGSHLPLRGEATVEVDFGPGGAVRSAYVVSSDASRDEWEELVAQARARAAAPEGTPTRGQRVRIRVTTDKLLPSGRHAGVAVDVFGLPLKRGEGPKSTKVSVLGPPKVVMIDGGIPLPVLALPLAEVDADLADLGAAPKRVVHTQVISRQVQ
jgi:hypothetical protein